MLWDQADLGSSLWLTMTVTLDKSLNFFILLICKMGIKYKSHKFVTKIKCAKHMKCFAETIKCYINMFMMIMEKSFKTI